MEVCRRSSWLLLLLGVSLLATALQGVQGEIETDGPSESECRPYIEKALKELETGDAGDTGTPEADGDSKEDVPTVEITTDDSEHQDDDGDGDDDNTHEDAARSTETTDDQHSEEQQDNTQGKSSGEENNDEPQTEQDGQSVEEADDTKETTDDGDDDDGNDQEEAVASAEDQQDEAATSQEGDADDTDDDDKAQSAEDQPDTGDSDENKDSVEEKVSKEEQESVEAAKDGDSKEDDDDATAEANDESVEAAQDDSKESKEDEQNDTKEDDNDTKEADDDKDDSVEGDQNDTPENDKEDEKSAEVQAVDGAKSEEQADDGDSKEDDDKTAESRESAEKADGNDDDGTNEETDDDDDDDERESGEEAPVEELSLDIEIPTDLRPRDHVEQLLKLDDESSETENVINRIAEITLRELKKLYENAIKPLEVLYKYRDLSNRHFGDAEIFSKPLILFMGPWSGGKSSIINYLLDNEYNETSLRTGAEPSPAYFNILMHGDEPEVIDGTQLAADFTFSGLQKFGQGLEERLRGVKLPSKLLERVNVVEIPGILEVRKQVSRVFPFNDACQWFIDRADIIFLVYDPSKLDVGPETEAILDQLKGREHQTRIVLNKADQVKPEELMRVQGALIWNISPLMSSAQPPVMYTTSLWSRPYEPWAPVKLLQAQERAFLRDLRTAVDRRIENKIASARRFAVRVRNHAKMVDCYLTTYYNHKSVFGNRKQVADEIVDHPQDYHIYEGLSTLTNISRYDLPDPDVYRDFFKLNPLYDFQQLSATCTYFRGCPINRLDVAIAYDLPEMVGKHKKLVESALAETSQSPVPGS